MASMRSAYITRLDLSRLILKEVRCSLEGAEKTIRQFRPVMMVEIAGAFLEEQASYRPRSPHLLITRCLQCAYTCPGP
jgi:hypothetical protein